MLPPMLTGITLSRGVIMNTEEWKEKNNRRRNYAHFDSKISLNDVWDYISNPEKVAAHGFYPFIRYEQKSKKYNGKETKTKVRELCYSAHIDRFIFQYYGYQLNQLYNQRVETDGVSNSVIAYRDNLGKNNIHFAKQAIDFIRRTKSCYIIVGDFTKFFDSLDHKYLKKMLIDLLGATGLPADFYAIYKNITKYSLWDMKTILNINGLKNNRRGIQELNKLERALSFQQFKENKKRYAKPNKQDFGIPQGSAISAVLSNIYMLEFDKQINDYICDRKGLYMRYSDDFIIILPKKNEEAFKAEFSFIEKAIDSIPHLDLQPDKTKIYEYINGELTNCNKLVLVGVENDKNILNYLGFSFDGKVVTIRDKTITKYYYRMYRKLKTIVKRNGRTKDDKTISCKNLYEKYSIKGAHIGKGNFLSYVKRAEAIFGDKEAISRGTKNHMQKIRKKLNQIDSPDKG